MAVDVSRSVRAAGCWFGRSLRRPVGLLARFGPSTSPIGATQFYISCADSDAADSHRPRDGVRKGAGWELLSEWVGGQNRWSGRRWLDAAPGARKRPLTLHYLRVLGHTLET